MPELWGNFALNHQGFCVGFDTLSMFANKELFGGGSAVDYYPTPTPLAVRSFCMNDLEKLEDMMKIIYFLPDIYAREEEYRLTKIDISSKLVPINLDSIEEMILGSKMNSKDEADIIQKVRMNLPKTKLLKATFDAKTKTFLFATI